MSARPRLAPVEGPSAPAPAAVPGRGYRYPDRDDRIPGAAMIPDRVRSGVSWDEADVRTVREAAARLGRAGRIRAADVGAGAGRLLPVLADLATSVTVIEPDPVRLAAARASAAGLTSATFSFAGVSAQAFAAQRAPGRAGGVAADRAGPFDLVVCSHVIQHIASTQRPGFAAALCALTAAEGVLVIMFPVTATRRARHLLTSFRSAGPGGQAAVRTSAVGRPVFDAAVTAPAAADGPLPVWHAGHGQVEGLLARAGFEILERISYRSFSFGLTTGRQPQREVRGRAADLAVVARPVVEGGQWQS